jgi:hypothetical protein
MSTWLVIIVTFIYAFVAIDQMNKGNLGLATVYFGYTIANFGLVVVVE